MVQLMMNHSIRAKLLLSFLFVSVILISFGLYVIYMLSLFQVSFGQIEGLIARRDQLGNVISLNAQAITRSRAVVHAPETAESSYGTILGQLNQFLDELSVENEMIVPADRSAFVELQGLLGILRSMEAQAIEARDVTILESVQYQEAQDEVSSLLGNSMRKLSDQLGAIFTQLRLNVIQLQVLALALLIVALVSIAGVYFLLRSLIVAPLQQLTAAATEFSEERFKTRVNIHSNDEIGHLASVFNQMAARIESAYSKLEDKVKERTMALEQAKVDLEEKVQERTGELERARQGLEEEVSRRTKELENKIIELEKFNKIAVGREQRMIELKAELDSFKQQPGTPNDVQS